MDVEALLPGRLQATFWPGTPVPATGHLALWGVPDVPAAARDLGLPVGDAALLPTVLPRTPRARTRVARADVPARVVATLPAVRALVALPPSADWPAWRRPSASVLAWSVAAKLACELVAAGRLVPGLRAGPGVAVAQWRAAPSGDRRLDDLAAALPPAAHALRDDEGDDTVWAADALLAAFCDAVADACARAPRVAAPAPGRARRTWPAVWLQALTGDDPIVRGAPADTADLAEDLAAWSAPLMRHDRQAGARLCLRLQAPEAVAGDEPEDTPWRLSYLLQAADDPSLYLPADQVWGATGSRVELAGRRIGDPQEALVRGLAEAARLFPPVDASLSQPRPVELALDAHQAAAFVAEAAGSLTAAGIGVWLPAELTSGGQRRLRARLRVGRPSPAPGAVTGAGFDAEGLADFRWEVALGEDTLSAEEFREIAALKRPLVCWRGRWVLVDPQEAGRLAELAGARGQLGAAEAIAAALTGQAQVDGVGPVEAVADGALATLVERVRSAGNDPKPRFDGVDAVLRGYQQRGAAWLQTMAGLGLGAVLADDMGLGKTLQAITLLADRAAQGGGPHLVVCPTSVVGNWERELARFAPKLAVVAHHGAERAERADQFPPGSVAVTSYGLLRRDTDLLAAVEWDVVVLDEAQQVKNHASRGARAARRLPARTRVALTGTPVENRLAELWSIMDFANQGLLGPFGRFKERYAVPVERWHDEDAAARLRRLVAPFVLRRVKDDVATDLPAKHETTVVCGLTREQATLYQAAVDAAFAEEGLGQEPLERRGRILALLTALKQICNHPAQYLREAGPLARRSGKLARATEMLGEVVAAGDRALVFTQYRGMGELLAGHLAAALGLPGVPFLHGGVPAGRRQAMVDAFQTNEAAPPLLLVSLKAGGTGLNLTRATQVLHYDRWWNPAVEDQATDRAHRIGQTRQVTVHKLVTAGSVEERIAALLEDKRALADAVVGAGEAWLTELSDDELHDLVALSAGDVTDEPEEAA